MKPTGSGEDGSMRASAGQDRQEHAAVPRPSWNETADVNDWQTSERRRRTPGRHVYSRGRPPTRAGNVARGLTGSLAAGLMVLAVTLLGVQLWSDAHGKFGPGMGVLIGHFLAAGLALLLQAVADRRRDMAGGLSALGVFAVVIAALTTWWWM